MENAYIGIRNHILLYISVMLINVLRFYIENGNKFKIFIAVSSNMVKMENK